MAEQVAIFDLDGTLIRLPSSERRFVAQLWVRRLINWRRAALFASFPLAWLPRFGRDVARKNKAYLSGLDVALVQSLGRAFAAELLAEVPRTMRGELEQHQRAGRATLLLTGSPDFIAEPLGALLGFSEVIATRPAQRGGRYTWMPPLVHPMGKTKLALARDFCQRRGTTLAAASAYGDSRLEIPLLAQCARPVAVDPDSHLRHAAAARGWRILELPA